MKYTPISKYYRMNRSSSKKNYCDRTIKCKYTPVDRSIENMKEIYYTVNCYHDDYETGDDYVTLTIGSGDKYESMRISKFKLEENDVNTFIDSSVLLMACGRIRSLVNRVVINKLMADIQGSPGNIYL